MSEQPPEDRPMMHYALTLRHIIERAELLFPDREVVWREPDGSVARTNYRAVAERSRALGAALTGLGVGPGDRVATLGWNHANHLEAYFGVPNSGAVLHTINPRLHRDQLDYIMAKADDRVLLIDQSLLPLLDDLSDEARPDHVIVWSQPERSLPEGVLGYEQVLASSSATAWEPPAIHEDAPASMCFTSATTGNPKGVVYTHRALVLHSIVEAMPDEFNLGAHDVVMPVVPMFHVNAWGLPYTSALVGAKQVLPGPQLDPASLLQLMTDEGVTFTGGVPTIWLRVLEHLREPGVSFDLDDVRTLLVGGSAAPPSLIAAFDQLGVKVLHAWGMTETSPLGSVARLKPGMELLPDADQLAARATQGLPAPLVEVRIAERQASPSTPGQSFGELEIRGPWIAASYVGGVAADRFTRDGWLRTGDIASISSEGYITISDRVNDLIKSGGEWISSVDLENCLMEHDDVAEAAVIAVPDDVWGERPLAVVVRANGSDVAGEALLDLLRARFAKWQVPDRVLFAESIPKTATGKFSKKQLRDTMGSSTGSTTQRDV